MKKLLCVAMLVPSVAFAAANKPTSAEGYYGRVDLGVDMRVDNKVSIPGVAEIKIKNNKTAAVGFGLGYTLNEYLRSDLNLQIRNLKTVNKNDSSDHAKNNAVTAMLNGFVDLPTGTMFTPYGMVGVGMSSIQNADQTLTVSSGSISYKRKNSTGFAWNAGLGVKTTIQDNISLDLGYKFVNVGQMKYKINGVSKKSKVQAHELAAGVIFAF
ncbi:MAG: porin family protein [Rickettsiales bacterium]|nr:porin family protein [Rickettsiales bacterium]